MSLPDRLYFHVPGRDLAPRVIAEARTGWDYLPSLWRIMLANGAPGSIISPVSGEPGEPSETIVVPAREAVERVAVFHELILGHPLLHRFPTLPVFLAGALCFLREQLAAYEGDAGSAVQLTAQVGRIRFDGDAIEYAETYTETWQYIEAMTASGEYHMLDEVLGFSYMRHSFTQWRAWAHLFGLETLADPYFTRLEYGGYWTFYHAAPAVKPFRPEVEAMARREEQAQIPETVWKMLKGGMRLLGKMPKPSDYKGTGYLPVNSAAWLRDNELTLIEPSADSEDLVEHDTEADGDSDLDAPYHHDVPDYDQWFYRNLMPVTENGKAGLRNITTVGISYTLRESSLPAEWDDIVHPRHDTAWARQGASWSLIGLGEQSKVIMRDCCDDIGHYDYAGTTCTVSLNGLQGLIDTYEQRWLAPPQFEEITCWDHTGTSFWLVCKNSLWGMLDEDGSQIHPCIFDSMTQDIREKFEFTNLGWQVVQAGRAGWITAEGRVAVSCRWDEVLPCEAPGLYIVRTGACWGLVADGDAQWLPCDYLSVEPIAMGSHFGHVNPSPYPLAREAFWPDEMDVATFIAAADPAGANVLVKVSTRDGTGIVDQANRLLVPCAYQQIDVAASGNYPDSRWLIIQAHDGRYGLWDVGQGKEHLPCASQWLAMVVSRTLNQPIVWHCREELHTLHHLDGSVAFDGSFRWLDGDYHEPFQREKPDFAAFAAGKLREAWEKGESVAAMLAAADDGMDELVQLRLGQPIMSEVDSLTEAFMQRAECGAALSLARRYLSDAYGATKDIALARAWAGRACGYQASPAATHAQDDQDGQRQRVLEEAARLFADMVYQGAGGAADVGLARHWAEAAAGVDQHGGSAETRLVLARILLYDSASPADAARACELLEDISAPALEEGIACYYRAQCLRDGKGVQPDWDLALALLVRADANGLYGVAEDIAHLLREMSTALPMKTARLLMREADYYESKHAASEPDDER